MQAVGFGIVNVIETVDAAGGQTEGEESHDARPDIMPVGSAAIEEQGREDKQVLQPLVGAHQRDRLSIHVSSALDRGLMTGGRSGLWR